MAGIPAISNTKNSLRYCKKTCTKFAQNRTSLIGLTHIESITSLVAILVRNDYIDYSVKYLSISHMVMQLIFITSSTVLHLKMMTNVE